VISLFTLGCDNYQKLSKTYQKLSNAIPNINPNHLEEGGQIDVIYTDFAKAFDKVPHCRLIIKKLRSYHIKDQLILWIKDFLLHGSQRVKINNEFSDWHSVIGFERYQYWVILASIAIGRYCFQYSHVILSQSL